MQLIPGDAKRLERVVRRVLVAEDDEDTRTLLAWGLRLHGYEVVECKSGTELFEVLTMCLNAEEQMPDVILSDIRMPGFTGLEVLGCIDRAELGVPFILMTAFSDEETRKRGENDGAAAFLAKPFEFEKLLAAIDSSLGIPHKEPEPASESTTVSSRLGGRFTPSSRGTVVARPVTSTRAPATGRPASARPSDRPPSTRPGDRASTRPSERVGARPSDRVSARPSDRGTARPIEAGSARPIDAMSARPIEAGSARPIDAMSARPSEDPVVARLQDGNGDRPSTAPSTLRGAASGAGGAERGPPSGAPPGGGRDPGR